MVAKQVISGDKLIEFGRLLESKGYDVGEHPDFGGYNAALHMPGSWHGKRGAIDVNWPGSNEKAKLDEAVALAKKYGIPGIIWQSTGHYGHAHFDVSDWRRIGTTKGTSGGFGGGANIVNAGLPDSVNPLSEFNNFLSKITKEMTLRFVAVIVGLLLILIALFSLDDVTATVQKGISNVAS